MSTPLPNKVIQGVELPNSLVLFDMMVELRDCSPARVLQIRDTFLKIVKLWVTATDRWHSIEFREDPELLLETLLDLQEYCCELKALCASIFRKIKTETYIDKLENGEDEKTKKPPSHDVREYYARRQASEIEGVESLLDSKTSYINNRISILKSSVSRY